MEREIGLVRWLRLFIWDMLWVIAITWLLVEIVYWVLLGLVKLMLVLGA
jgi:hypothetical protein